MARVSHPAYELRPLKSVELLPPDYKISQHELIESYIEKAVKLVGIIPDVAISLDSTNRTEVLRIIDQGKRNKFLPRTVSHEHDAIFYLNARNIKLSTRDQNEDLIIRLPIHQIAAMSYVREDDTHILCIKYGELDMKRHQMQNGVDDAQTAHVAVLYCDCARTAEELCAVLDQCFQAVYTDATMHYFDRSLMLSSAQNPLATGSGSVDYSFIGTNKSATSTPKVDHRVSHANPATLGFLSHSSLNLGGTLSSATSRSLSRTTGAASESELSAAANQLILEYMEKLYTRLNAEELHRFALLVKAWHTDLSFPDFCNGVYELYGPERKHLLIGMQPFIPGKDLLYFEHFIERVGLNSSQMDSPAIGRGHRPQVSSSAWFMHQASNGDDSTDLESFDFLSDVSNYNERLKP